MKRANEFGTKVTCESSQVSEAILKAFTEAQKAIKDKNAKGLASAITEVEKGIIITYMQVGGRGVPKGVGGGAPWRPIRVHTRREATGLKWRQRRSRPPRLGPPCGPLLTPRHVAQRATAPQQATITYAHEMYLDKAAKLDPDEHQVCP